MGQNRPINVQNVLLWPSYPPRPRKLSWRLGRDELADGAEGADEGGLGGWCFGAWRPVFVKVDVDPGGISHHLILMVKAVETTKGKKRVTVVRDYDVAADAKSRISLRGARTKYFHVMALSNGSFLLEPRVLVAPYKIPARTRKMLESSVASLKRGKASAPIDLSPFIWS